MAIKINKLWTILTMVVCLALFAAPKTAYSGDLGIETNIANADMYLVNIDGSLTSTRAENGRSKLLVFAKTGCWNCQTNLRLLNEASFCNVDVVVAMIDDSTDSEAKEFADKYCSNCNIICYDSNYIFWKYVSMTNLTEEGSITTPGIFYINPENKIVYATSGYDPDIVSHVSSYLDNDSCIITTPNNEFVIKNGVLLEYNGNGGDVVIPDGVTSIADNVFCDYTYGVIDGYYDCIPLSNVTSITMPDSVVSIGRRSFAYCTKLKKVKFSKNLKEIGEHAFAKCISLTSVNLPKGLKTIKMDAFQASGLTKIVVPASVTNLGGGAFCYCENLKSVSLPKGLKALLSDDGEWVTGDGGWPGSGMFQGCTSLEEIDIPETVVEFGGRCFYKTKWLENKLKDNPILIVNNVLVSVKEGTDAVYVPEGVTRVAAFTFWFDSNVSKISLPKSLKTVDGLAFGHNLMEQDSELKICYLGTEKEWKKVSIYNDYDSNARLVNATLHYGHTKVTDKAVAATYSKTGLTAGSHCKICGMVTKAQKVVAKKKLSVPVISYAKNSTKGKVTVKWNSVADATGYQISYTVGKTTKKISVKASSKSTLLQVISDLNKGKTYSIKLRAYKKIGNNTYYSAWSSAKKVKISL